MTRTVCLGIGAALTLDTQGYGNMIKLPGMCTKKEKRLETLQQDPLYVEAPIRGIIGNEVTPMLRDQHLVFHHRFRRELCGRISVH
ncbi:hypothetical protein DPMN_179363 [Dreissena polymorpha]|uniref:Uncharacterized protein n=1 Tax=Dreissena polymorpha TaxID=45954 RepID=A0A9D4EEZ3_DREPO|nr:hypothetical protein DPMN_179363 [Dreissena polymorpha]